MLRISPLESIMTDKQADIIVVIEGNDGFLGALVPDFSALLEHQLTTSSALGSKDSEASYRMDLVRFNRWRLERPADLQKIDKTLIEEYLKYMRAKGYAPATIERTLASLRWYVRGVIDLLHDNSFLQQHLPSEKKEELLELAKRCLRAKKPKGSRGEGIEAGRYVPLAEINLLMESFSMDETKAGCRDRAMLSIGWRLGPRVSEIAGLSMKSISPVSGSPKLEYEIMIIGKGNKQRPAKLILDQNAAIYLREWLEMRGNALGALFCYITRGDHLRRLDQHLSPRALHLILKNRLAEANRVSEAIKPLTWHDFRRTVISDIIADSKQGGLVEAQKIAGHSSVITTARYDRLWREKINAALKSRPDVPYHVRNTAKGKDAQVAHDEGAGE
jgi:site-specific recombinase XerD